ncbi:MAG: YegS/Rv2252/BmrU family lipid kinase [Caryophanon sp.]|nr:YegS/Rv2252/BmrU family lipid kinase [Caryophanon sp.]
MQLAFIVNETAGQGKQVWAQLAQTLTIPYSVHKTRCPQHATEIVTQLARDADALCVIAVGGDGTIHEVLQGAIHYPHVIVGACRAGSGNDFARTFSTFSSAADIERWYAQQRTTTHDVGSWDERIFMNNAGIGFDAYVVQLANMSTLKKKLNRLSLGKLSYVYFLIKGLMTYNTFSVDINGVQYDRVWFVTISNQPYFGGGMKIAPHSKTDDGMLECTIVHRLSRLKLLSVFMTVFWGGHTRFREVTQLQDETFSLHVREALPCHVDGEAFINDTLHVHVAVQPHRWQNAQNE